MAFPVIPRTETPSDRAIAIFLTAFADGNGDDKNRAKVKSEIVEYWKQQGTLKSPTEIYAHLMDKRVTEGKISERRGALLKAIFDDTFSPEHSTGYLPKHRESLVNGLARLYVSEAKPDAPVYRIEGDISNLGGLNKAMIESAEQLQKSDPKAFARMLEENSIKGSADEAAGKLGRAMADRVMHTICQITSTNLEHFCDILPVRKGGDEISFIATMKDGVTVENVANTLDRTQKEVARFVTDAGLKLVPHTKAPNDQRRSGIGIGLQILDMRKYSPEEERDQIETGISVSKKSYQKFLHRNRKNEEPQPITVPDMLKLEAQIKQERYKSSTEPLHTVMPNLLPLEYNTLPDEQRLNTLKNFIRSLEPHDLTPAEERIINATHALTRRNDYVTSLPVFENMESDQLGYFKNKIDKPHPVTKTKPGGKLVNIDFNLVAGGNLLSEEVGDAMLRSFRDITIKAAMRSGFEESNACLTVRPGAKFATLIRGNASPEKLSSYPVKLAQLLKEDSDKPLPLSKAVLDGVRKKIAESSKEIGNGQALADIYGANGERLFDDKGQIRMSRIMNQKTGLAGPDVAVAISGILDYSQSLGEQMRPLEKETNRMHDAIIAERREKAGMPPLKQTQAERLAERAAGPSNAQKR